MTPSAPALAASSSSAAAATLGRIEPRIWTPPLRPLTHETSYGFDVIDFARDVLGQPLDEWQEWAVIHGGELLPDGRPRFHTLLILVARQNGKTTLLTVLTLFWLWIDRVKLVLGTSSKLEYAAESWRAACRLARAVPELRAEIPSQGGIRKANGEQTLWRADAGEFDLDTGSRYKIAAANEDAGRSLTVNRLVLDELRQHHDYDCWDAAEPTTSAVADAQIWAISNAGSDKSVVLNELREAAIQYIETGEGDPGLGILEYSAPEDAQPDDIEALAQANPNLGRRVDAVKLLGKARTAMAKGGEKLTGFKTEYMCIRVKVVNAAIDVADWENCLKPGDLEHLRGRIALCVDVSMDAQHATLVAAALDDAGRVRVEPVAAWSGPGCIGELRRDLPGHVAKVKPRVLGWFTNGPAAALAADMRAKKSANWPPRGVKLETMAGDDATTACMGLAEQIKAGDLLHSDDPLLTAHITGAEKLMQGDRWRFTRRGAGHCDAAYATAGAVHLARTLPAAAPKAGIVSR